MKRKVIWLLSLVFVLGAIVGSTVHPRSVAAAGSSVQFWGPILDDPNSSYKLLVLYDSSTGEIWGYHAIGGRDLVGNQPPIRLGKLTKVGTPIVN